jgi:pilus assembly protein CpaE
MTDTMTDPHLDDEAHDAIPLEQVPEWVDPPSAGPAAVSTDLAAHGVDTIQGVSGQDVSGHGVAGGALIAADDPPAGEHSVPRIAIHFFCRQEETAAAAARASADRRLSRATPKVLRGGLNEAIAIYREQPTPPLIVVECLEPGMELLQKLESLAEVCDPSTKVVVIGASNDIALYRELMRRGVSEYLVPPIQPLQLIRTIAGLYADPTTPFVGRTIGFVGSKGGVGASTLAHNVAHTMAEQIKLNTVVADYDLAFGTAGLDFNQDPLQGVYDALHQPDRLDPVLLDRMTARCTEHLSLLAAPATLDDVYEFGPEVFDEVFNRIRTTAPFVVLDIPHMWNSWVRQMILSCDDLIIVATPELASLRNTKNMVDLIRKARPNDAPPRLILNQMGIPGRPEIPVKEFARALQLEPALVLPFDAKLFGEAANNGQMLIEVNPKAKTVEGLLEFSLALSRREPAAPPPKTRSLIERLLKRA